LSCGRFRLALKWDATGSEIVSNHQCVVIVGPREAQERRLATRKTKATIPKRRWISRKCEDGERIKKKLEEHEMRNLLAIYTHIGYGSVHSVDGPRSRNRFCLFHREEGWITTFADELATPWLHFCPSQERTCCAGRGMRAGPRTPEGSWVVVHRAVLTREPGPLIFWPHPSWGSLPLY
jgi:hypothetical protein